MVKGALEIEFHDSSSKSTVACHNRAIADLLIQVFRRTIHVTVRNQIALQNHFVFFLQSQAEMAERNLRIFTLQGQIEIRIVGLSALKLPSTI